MPVPINKILYEKVKNEAKKKFTSYPSIYANSWVVREYKKRGGKYKGKKNSREGLLNWFNNEKWVNMKEYLKGKIVPCSKQSVKTGACRPLHKGGRNLLTADEVIKLHGKSKIKKIILEKEKDLSKRINWRKCTIT